MDTDDFSSDNEAENDPMVIPLKVFLIQTYYVYKFSENQFFLMILRSYLLRKFGNGNDNFES